MASQRSTNTMVEVLQRMLQDIAMAKTLPDADLQFLVQLETMILNKLKAPIDATQGSPQGAPAQDMSGGAGGGAMPPSPPGLPPGLPPQGPPLQGVAPPAGVMAGPNMPNPDELRRLIQGS